MKIKCTSKEIADFVLEIQNRQENKILIPNDDRFVTLDRFPTSDEIKSLSDGDIVGVYDSTKPYQPNQ